MCRPDTTPETKNTTTNLPVPLAARAYLAVYDALPAIRVPFTNLDVAFMLLGTVFLTGVRFASEHVLVTVFGWPRGPAVEEAAAGCTSVCHSTILCAGLIAAFATQKYDVAAVLKDQTDRPWWPRLADALLQFCTGYMLYDTLVGILWLRFDASTGTFAFTPDDYLFLMHHWMTSFYMTSARVIGAGYMSAFICMLLGELSNPLQNAWLVGQMAMELDCCNGPKMEAFTHAVKIGFAAVYLAIRAGIAPVYFVHCSYNLTFTKKGRENIPLALGIFWNMLIWGVAFGSSSWITKCYNILADEFFAAGGGGGGGEQQEL